MPTVLVNGVNYSWVNVSLILFSAPVVGIVAIDYKRKQEKKNNYGAGKRPVSRGYGREEYEASIELYMDEWKAIIAASPNRNPNEIPFFNIPITFSGDGVLTTKDVLMACEFTEDSAEMKEGDTRFTVKLPLIIGGINR